MFLSNIPSFLQMTATMKIVLHLSKENASNYALISAASVVNVGIIF